MKKIVAITLIQLEAILKKARESGLELFEIGQEPDDMDFDVTFCGYGYEARSGIPTGQLYVELPGNMEKSDAS